MSEEDAGSASQSELDELDNELQGTFGVLAHFDSYFDR